MPDFVLDKLVKKSIVEFNIKNSLFTNIAGQVVSFADEIRENIAKPLYHAMPVSFKVWYDEIRYKA